MRFTAAIPLPAALAVHRSFGTLSYYLTPRRRLVVRRNIELCFPELSAATREALVKSTFASVGASFAECAIAWFAPARRLKDRFRIRGIEHLRNALEHGKGVILYTGHFTALEICGRPFKELTPRFACMFSRRSNPLLDEIQRRGRLVIAHELVASDNVRSMLKSLKSNAVVWYAPDQAAIDGGELIPFFHELAMTNVATSKLARISGAAVVPFSYRRLSDQARYELCFHPPLSDFPSADPVADTRRLVRRLEDFIRVCPEQYQWLHRRFKGRPPALEDLYAQRVAANDRPPTPTSVLPTDLEFSLVIPLNNEEPNVRPLLTELCRALEGIGGYELLIVDDGSTDATVAEVRRFAEQDRRLRLLRHATRRGQSTAIYNGIRAATKELVVVLDGDLQNDPADIGPLLSKFCGEPDRGHLGLVIGHRIERRDSRIRRWSSRVANAVRSRILHDGTPDTGCGLKVIRRSLFMQLPYFDHMHRFLPALVRRAGFRVASMPVRHRPRLHGTAHYGVLDRAWVGVVDLVGVAWLARRTRSLDFREERK